MCLSLRSPRDARLCGGRDIFTPSQGQAVSDSDLRLVVARFDSDRDAAFNLVRDAHAHPPAQNPARAPPRAQGVKPVEQ